MNDPVEETSVHEPEIQGDPVESQPDNPGLARGARLAVIGVAVLGVLFVIAAATVVPHVVERLHAAPVDRTLQAVEVFPDLPTTHTGESVEYPTEPPVGGRHAAAWLDCGVYEEQVPAENLVHDLEHGTVVIAHALDLDPDEVARLVELLPSNGILTPWAGMEAPVVVTVWGHRLALTGAEDPRLELFIAELGNGETAPEPGASCAGGIEPPADPGITQV